MPRLALFGYALYVALAFGLRAVVHWRRTGTTGFVGLSGRPGSLEWLAGVLFAVALVGGVAAPLAQLAGAIGPWSDAGDRAVHGLGLGVFAVGLAGTLRAQFAMGESWRIGVDPEARTDLVAQGPFRWVRNPIYSWMTLASAGLVLICPNLLAVAALAALLVALEIQVRVVEEPYLLRTHGDAYRRYAASTGRFVPGIGRWTANTGAGESRPAEG
jgi:protein-S-isoprenylcysteine O-methyltransferase Ste14